MKTDDFLERLDRKLDDQGKTLNEISRVQVQQAAILREHIRRTVALETMVDTMRKDHDAHVKDAVTWPFVGKIIAGLGGAGAAAKGLWEMLKPHP